MEGVRLDRDELIRAYGISQRLAVRIGALLAKGLEVSATLLEMAGPGSALEKLLLHPEMLAGAERLDVEALKKLAAETGASREGELAIAPCANGRVLALQEEILAEQGWQTAVEASPTGLAKPEAGLAPARVLDSREARKLFDAEEIARIKIEALAGRDAEARVSALRKLVFAPISAQEKGGIYLRALLDPSTQVRSEAIKSLESLGFNRDTADAMQSLFAGDERARHAALRRIGDLMSKLQPGEEEIALAVLLEMFRESRLKGPDDPLLQLLNDTLPVFARYPGTASEVARGCVQHLLIEPARLGPLMRDMLSALATAAPAAVLGKLWEEISTVSDPAPRALLLGLLLETERDEGRIARLCDLIAQELLRPAADEVTRQRLGHNFARLGGTAVEAMLSRFASGSNAEKAMLAPFLDLAGSGQGLAAEEVNRVAREFLEALKVADRRLRMEILRGRVFRRPEVDAELRKALAQELLSLLRSKDSPEVADCAAALLEPLGEVAAEDLFEMIRAHPAAAEADTAVRLLGRVLAQLQTPSSPAAKLVPPAFQFLCRQVASPSNSLGGYAAALGQVACSPLVRGEEAQRALDLLMKRLGRVRYHGELVEAIGKIGACAAVTRERQVRTIHLLSALLERPSRQEDAQFRKINTARGRVYEITGRIEFDSETLPAAVHGLEEIALSARTTPALRRRITAQFLRIWSGVASWTVIWGPRASEALGRALGRLGADERSDDETRARVIAGLGAAVERMSVVGALRDIFSVRSAAPELNRLTVEVASKMLDHWIQPEITPDELQAVLLTAAEAASRPEIRSRSAQARRLRERTAELLFDAMRAGHPWFRGPLEKMRDCPAVPRRLRKDIASRLAQAPQYGDITAGQAPLVVDFTRMKKRR